MSISVRVLSYSLVGNTKVARYRGALQVLARRKCKRSKGFNGNYTVRRGIDFIGRNQHHIRSQVYPSSAISGLLEDLADDLRRFVPAMTKRDRALVSSLIIAAGAEAIFRVNREPRASMKYLRDFLPKFMLNGLTEWNASAAAKPSA
jgi:hypothetical protein